MNLYGADPDYLQEWYDKFQKAIDELDDKDIHPILLKAQSESLKSVQKDIKKELDRVNGQT